MLRARTRGVEFDTLIQLFPERLDNLVLSAGAAYIDATFTEYPDGSGFDDDPASPTFGSFEQGQDFSGKRRDKQDLIPRELIGDLTTSAR